MWSGAHVRGASALASCADARADVALFGLRCDLCCADVAGQTYSSLVNEPLARSASAIALPPSGPISLSRRLRLVSEPLTASAAPIALAPSTPIQLLSRSRLVSEPLTRSTLATTFAPLFPVPFPWRLRLDSIVRDPLISICVNAFFQAPAVISLFPSRLSDLSFTALSACVTSATSPAKSPSLRLHLSKLSSSWSTSFAKDIFPPPAASRLLSKPRIAMALRSVIVSHTCTVPSSPSEAASWPV
eukprot:scaffold25384_cov30-Phaeocystis_antarctica.AAC.1